MTRSDRLAKRFREARKTFPWNDFCALMRKLGYARHEMAGSRVRFTHPEHPMILLHRPHPGNELRGAALRAVQQTLQQEGVI